MKSVKSNAPVIPVYYGIVHDLINVGRGYNANIILANQNIGNSATNDVKVVETIGESRFSIGDRGTFSSEGGMLPRYLQVGAVL